MKKAWVVCEIKKKKIKIKDLSHSDCHENIQFWSHRGKQIVWAAFACNVNVALDNNTDDLKQVQLTVPVNRKCVIV